MPLTDEDVFAGFIVEEVAAFNGRQKKKNRLTPEKAEKLARVGFRNRDQSDDELYGTILRSEYKLAVVAWISWITFVIKAIEAIVWLIKKLRAIQIQQVVREDVPSRHLAKNRTPTMGGSLI